MSLKFRARLGGKVRYMYVKRRKASVLIAPVAVREQWITSVVGEQQLLVQ